MIKKIGFKNYKAFSEKQEIEVKPITLLIGKNSSGKSAVAKLFPLMQTSFTKKINVPLLYESDGVEWGAEFRDLVFDRNPNVPIDFYFSFMDESELLVSVIQPTGSYKPIIFKWTYKGFGSSISLSFNHDNGCYLDEFGARLYCNFTGFLPDSISDEFGNLVYVDLVEEIKSKSSISVDYIGPFRVIPPRTFQLNGEILYDKVGVDGRNAYSMLANSRLEGTDLMSFVNEWFKENYDGWGIDVDISRYPILQTVLHNEEKRPRLNVNISDVGQGIGQVLPLVVAAFNNEAEITVVEQPELHLHPAAHGSLAELFVESSKNKNRRFIIESHSELFLLRFRKLVIEGKFGFGEDDIIIYWIEEGVDGNDIQEIKINSEGVLSDWPTGVFGESVDEILSIKKLLKQRL